MLSKRMVNRTPWCTDQWSWHCANTIRSQPGRSSSSNLFCCCLSSNCYSHWKIVSEYSHTSLLGWCICAWICAVCIASVWWPQRTSTQYKTERMRWQIQLYYPSGTKGFTAPVPATATQFDWIYSGKPIVDPNTSIPWVVAEEAVTFALNWRKLVILKAGFYYLDDVKSLNWLIWPRLYHPNICKAAVIHDNPAWTTFLTALDCIRWRT